jgi:hypothetical protein
LFPGERIAWDSLLAEGHEDSSAYHGWVITPTDSGYNLLTEGAAGSFLSVAEMPTQYFRASQGLTSRKRHIWPGDGDLTMSTSEIEKVLTIFRGIASRDAELTTKYMNPGKYTTQSRTLPMALKG